MPLYEYQCRSCGHRFERIQKFSDPLAKKCPTCGKRVDKLVSSPAIQFKGTGWYVTDYARQGQKTDGAKDKDSAAGAAKDSTSGGEKAGKASSAGADAKSPPTSGKTSSSGAAKAATDSPSDS